MNRSVLAGARGTTSAATGSPKAMLNRVEAGIRAFDPCLSCSTHALGQMPLRVQLRAADGAVLDELARD